MQSNLPKVIVRFYPNEKTALTAFSIGEIESLVGLSDPKLVANQPQVKVSGRESYNRVVAVMYNTKDAALSSRSLRQALGYSISKIADENEAKTPIPPFSWAFNKDVKSYINNSESAKAALGRAKASSGSEMLKKEIILTATPQFENLGKQIVASWQNLGLKAILRVESGVPQNFQALLIAQSLPDDPDQYSIWHSTQVQTNLTKYDSKRVDKDLEDGRKLLKEEERIPKYQSFQREILEDAPATFLYFPKFNVAYLSKVEKELNQVLPLQLPK
jgi:peptide/nickel transport system substrate-binding protein